MQHGISFFMFSLLVSAFASAATDLDKCFEKEALPYLTSACEQVLKVVKTEEKYNCKSVVDARSLVLLGEATDIAGNVKVPAPAAALSSYTSYYKNKVEPYYRAKCFPKQQTTANNFAPANNQQQQGNGQPNTAAGAAGQVTTQAQRMEQANKELAKLDEKPNANGQGQNQQGQNQQAQRGQSGATQQQPRTTASEPAGGSKPSSDTVISSTEIQIVQGATKSNAPVTIVDVKKDANGNEISRTYSQDGQLITLGVAGGTMQVQTVKPNSGSGVIMTGDVSEEGRVTVDMAKLSGGKVMDQGQVTIAVDDKGRYILTGDVCIKGTPENCQERSRESVDVTEQMQDYINKSTKSAIGDSPCGKDPNDCKFEPMFGDTSIVGDVAKTAVNSASAPQSITEDVIHTCGSNPKASGCAGETYVTKDGLVVGFSQDGKTLLSGTPEQLATAEGLGFAKKNAVIVEKDADGSTSTRIFDANGEQTSHMGWASTDESLPAPFIAAANLPRGASTGKSVTVSDNGGTPDSVMAHDDDAAARIVTQPQDTTPSYTYDDFGAKIDRRTGKVIDETSAASSNTGSNVSSRTVVNGRTHCTDEMDEECQQMYANETGTTVASNMSNNLTTSDGGNTSTTEFYDGTTGDSAGVDSQPFYDGTTGDWSGNDGSGGALSLSAIADRALAAGGDPTAQLDQLLNQYNAMTKSDAAVGSNDMNMFKELEGESNAAAIAKLKAGAESLAKLGQQVNPQVDIASQAKQAIENYSKESKSCADYEKMASTACIAETNPTLKKTIEATQILLPVIQTVTGMNDACSKISKALGTVNKGLLIASTVCAGFQGICAVGCGKTASSFLKIAQTLKAAAKQIAANAEANAKAEISQCPTKNASLGAAAVIAYCKQFAITVETKAKQFFAQVEAADKQIQLAFASESNVSDPKAVAGKVAKCGSFTDTLKKTAAGILSLAQSNMQAKQCAAQTAANNDANKCQQPAHEGSLECLCQRAEFKNTQSCREFTTGCSIAGQMKNSAGVCVAQAEACQDPINANKPECLTVTAGQCAKAENAGKPECLCLVNPTAAGCNPDSTTTTTAGLTAGSTGASNLIPQNNNLNNNGGVPVDGTGFQKMGGDRTSTVANLNRNENSNGLGRVGLGSDGTNSDGTMGNPTAYGAANTASSGSGLGAGAGGGFDSSGREPASEGNGKGKAGGYKGASADSVGGGGYGGGSFGSLDWDREKRKNDALKKLNDKQEKNKMAGATILKNNGVTGATGKTLWEKISTRYRENKSTLMVD